MKEQKSLVRRVLSAATLTLAALIALSSNAAAQSQTTGGTQIQQTATATYDDGESTPTTFDAVSNTVTIEVQNVSGLSITPDAGSVASVVPGQSGAVFPFTVTNNSNYSARVRFAASGASASATNGTITQAFVDSNGNGTYDDGELDIHSNGSAVSTGPLAAGSSVTVIVVVNVSPSAAPNGSVTVTLGDAGGPSPYDNVTSDSSGGEVRTDSTGVSPAPANGESEAKGSASAFVDSDASLGFDNLYASTEGPVNYGEEITYTSALINGGAREAQPITLAGQAGIYLIMNVPANTTLKAGQTWPSGTLFSQDATSVAPLSATYSATEPTAASVRRVAFRVGNTLPPGDGSLLVNLTVTVSADRFDATDGVREVAQGYALNNVGGQLSVSDSLTTPFALEGAVLLGTYGHADAQLTTTADDYTNKSTSTGNVVADGGVTTAVGSAVFRNTLKNTGNATDSFRITAPSVPENFIVEASTDGTTFTDISNGSAFVTVADLAYDQTADVYVRVTAPAASTVLSAFPATIRATSVRTSASSNDTVNRLYTGYLRLTKAYTVSNATGRGGATDAVPGAVMTFTVEYRNISTAGGANCKPLEAHNLSIVEDGLGGSNNWGTYTDPHGTPSDSGPGSPATVSATKYTDTVTSLAAGSSGTFTFQRVIK